MVSSSQETRPQRRFSTGLPFLDYRLDGGIPVGGIVALAAPARSQSELLLSQFARHQPVHYLSTICPDEDELRERVEDTPGMQGDHTVAYAPPETVLEESNEWIGDIEPESYVIIDPVAPLETADRERYLGFLNHLKAHLRAVDSIAILHCPVTEPVPDHRGLTFTRADHVWELELTAHSSEIQTRLLITKSRGYRALVEPIPLVMTDTIVVDTSRNIA